MADDIWCEQNQFVQDLNYLLTEKILFIYKLFFHLIRDYGIIQAMLFKYISPTNIKYLRVSGEETFRFFET